MPNLSNKIESKFDVSNLLDKNKSYDVNKGGEDNDKKRTVSRTNKKVLSYRLN